jgi:hypothetical protein
MKARLKRMILRVMSPFLGILGARTEARLERLERQINILQDKADRNALLGAVPLVNQIRTLKKISALSEVEFKVFSQWGEDGIIQYLVSHVPLPNKIFVEFGVEDYREANTRFLLVNNNWEGLVLDADPELNAKLKAQDICWRYQLAAKSALITAENINDLISSSGISGDIGLLSVDIDGNDYWVWRAVSVISPRIVICEYNSVFGIKHPVTVPYQPDFNKTKYHHSNLCFGASLAAICRLAGEKGYDFIGSNSEGCNAFFVRKDLSDGLPKPSPAEGYVRSKFRSSVNEQGVLTFLSGSARLDAIKDAQVYNLATDQLVKIADLGEL